MAETDNETPETPERGDWLERMPGYTVPLILVGVPLAAWLVGLTWPDFYHQVIWKYYYGPIVADAADHASTAVRGGVTAEAGYNRVNTISWAVLLGLMVVGAAQILRRTRVPMNNMLTVGATLWVLAGSLFHVLQDARLFIAPLEYVYITPPIYLLFAAFGILSLVIGVYLRAVSEEAGLERAMQKLWLLFAAVILLYLVLWAQDWRQIQHYVHPALVALFGAATLYVFHRRVMATRRIDPAEAVVIFPLGTILLALAYLAVLIQTPWQGAKVPDFDRGVVSAFWLAPLLSGAVCLIVYWAGHAKRDTAFGAALTKPINLLIIFSQALDGFGTALGLDLAGYDEKHLVSELVIDNFARFAESIGWAFGAAYPTFFSFVPVKILISLLVVWAVDVYGREDAKENPNLVGLVKFAVIMVGFGPGVRNIVRLSLGI